MLFNLVFSLLLGDEIEPVERDVKVIIFLRIPFHGMVYQEQAFNEYKGGEQRV